MRAPATNDDTGLAITSLAPLLSLGLTCPETLHFGPIGKARVAVAIDGGRIRSAILQAIVDASTRYGPDGALHSTTILTEAAQALGQRLTRDQQQAVLTSFSDLFRTGHLAWGFDLSNPSPPKFHVTDQGRRTLEHLSRDPANPAGYLTHLKSRAVLNPIARSYVDEALQSYNSNCARAAAVMIGAAAESLILELRDVLVSGAPPSGRRPSKDLLGHPFKRVIDAVHKEFEMEQSGMEPALREEFGAFWLALVQQIRATRNEAGHPVSVAPITLDAVHAALLMFPELAGLWGKLMRFAHAHYK